MNSDFGLISIVTPVYNDWEAFICLVQDLSRIAESQQVYYKIYAVNDGSVHTPNPGSFPPLSPYIVSVEIIHLVRNLGHQRAIAVGLVEMERQQIEGPVIVMDADGEDRPEDVAKLLKAHREFPDRTIVALRGRRSEGLVFRLFYRLYKLTFWILVGGTIDFGNFSLIPRAYLTHYTHDANLWNHYSATLVRSTMPLYKVKIDRGTRYSGKSHMSTERLLLHGLSAISVFLDIVFIRILILSLIAAACAVVGIFVVIGIVLFTHAAIPGWATSAAGISLIILIQMMILSSGLVFFVLNMRSGILIVPAIDTPKLIRSIEVVVKNEPATV